VSVNISLIYALSTSADDGNTDSISPAPNSTNMTHLWRNARE